MPGRRQLVAGLRQMLAVQRRRQRARRERVQRVLATIVNIAANIAQRGIASVADLEDAVKLGLGYPQGPLALGDAIGPMRVLNILRNLQACTGDPRYRPSPWLQRRATLGVSLLTPEAARA